MHISGIPGYTHLFFAYWDKTTTKTSFDLYDN